MRPITKTGLKVAAALVALETTARYGVWKDSATSAAGYEDARQTVIGTVLPQVKPYVEKIPFPEVNIPQVDWTDKWNRGVVCTFSSLARLPSKSAELACRAKKAATGLFDSKPTVSADVPIPAATSTK